MKFQYRDGRVYSLFGVESVLFKDDSFKLGLHHMDSETVVTNECRIVNDSDSKYLLVFVAFRDGRIINLQLNSDYRKSFPININTETSQCNIANFEYFDLHSIFISEFSHPSAKGGFKITTPLLIHVQYGDTDKKIIKDIMEIIFTNDLTTITVENGEPLKYDIRDCTILACGEEMMVSYDDGRIVWLRYGETKFEYREVKFNKEERRISIGEESFGNVFSVQMRSNKPICF